MKIKTVKSFTLIELTAVVLIIGALAAIALPSFGTALERGYEADAVNQLRTINAAQMIYRSRTGRFWPQAGGGAGLNEISINSNLGLNVIENGFQISCSEGNTTFFCTAIRTGGAYTVGVDERVLGANNPCCNSALGTCPTLTAACI